MSDRTHTVHGQESWRIATDDVEAFVTRLGGHLGPVTFDRQAQRIRPFAMAPWADEVLGSDVPTLLRLLRGDFFCAPFGGNESDYHGERHPFHGETSCRTWEFVEQGDGFVHVSLTTEARAGRVDKWLRLRPGHEVLYQRHVISGMSGPMPLGHHAILGFPDRPGSGMVSTSPFLFGQVYPGEFERPDRKGYSCLLPGGEFASLREVPLANGGYTDLASFPARRGFEDLVMLVGDDSLPFGWTAVVFASEGFVWFSLRDPRVLRSTVLWISNGGRHYEPWSGRHVNVLGVEDVTAFFHSGLAESAAENSITARGYPTSVQLDSQNPLVVNHIMGVAAIPAGFDEVIAIEPSTAAGEVTLRSQGGPSITVPLDLAFLTETQP